MSAPGESLVVASMDHSYTIQRGPGKSHDWRQAAIKRISETRFASGMRRIGAEQEIFLVGVVTEAEFMGIAAELRSQKLSE